MRGLCILMFVACSLGLHAQDRKLIPLEFNIERGNHFQQALPFQNGLVTVYGRSDWYFYSSRLSLRFHDDKGTVVRDRKLQLQANGREALLLHAFAAGDTLYFVCASMFANKREMGWCMLAYDFTNDKLFNVITPQPTQSISPSWLLSGTVEIVYASDSSQGAVCVYPSGFSENAVGNICTFNLKKPDIESIKFSAPQRVKNNFQRVQTLIDDRGSIYLLGKTYKHGAFEIQNGKANYSYDLYKIESNALQPLHEIITNRVLRSGGGIITDETFFFNALVADTTFSRHDSIYSSQFSLHDRTNTIETVTALPVESGTATFDGNSFTNTTSKSGDAIVTVFESRNVDYNESARGTSGFAYERGNALVAIINLNGKIEQVTRLEKQQRYIEQPSTTLYMFINHGIRYAAYPEYRDSATRNSLLVLKNLHAKTEQRFVVMNVDWKREEIFYVVECSNTLVFLQPRMRSYAMFRMPL